MKSFVFSQVIILCCALPILVSCKVKTDAIDDAVSRSVMRELSKNSTFPRVAFFENAANEFADEPKKLSIEPGFGFRIGDEWTNNPTRGVLDKKTGEAGVVVVIGKPECVRSRVQVNVSVFTNFNLIESRFNYLFVLEKTNGEWSTRMRILEKKQTANQ